MDMGTLKTQKFQHRVPAWILAAAMAVRLAGCGGASVASNSSKPPAEHSDVTSPVAIGPTGTTPMPEILSVLSVEHQVDLSAEIEGPIISVAKDEGSLVRAGEVLGQIDDRTLKLELTKAENDLKVAQYNVKSKEADLKSKTATFERQKQLRQMGLLSQADLDAAEFAAKGAEYDLQGWEAQVESSQAERNRIYLLIEKCQLRAPFAGAVARRYVREGQTVAKGDKCFRVSQLAPLQVQFQVPEGSGPRPEIGASVNVFLPEKPGDPIQAKVMKVGPIVDPASDSYNVTAQLKGQTAGLRPGMAVRVSWPNTDVSKHP